MAQVVYCGRALPSSCLKAIWSSRMKSCCAMLVLLACSSIAGAEDWPQWLGAHRDGTTTETVEAWKSSPRAIWRVPVGAGFSTPVVAGGRVFVHALVPDTENEEVIALDAKSGGVAWRT